MAVVWCPFRCSRPVWRGASQGTDWGGCGCPYPAWVRSPGYRYARHTRVPKKGLDQGDLVALAGPGYAEAVEKAFELSGGQFLVVGAGDVLFVGVGGGLQELGLGHAHGGNSARFKQGFELSDGAVFMFVV